MYLINVNILHVVKVDKHVPYYTIVCHGIMSYCMYILYIYIYNACTLYTCMLPPCLYSLDHETYHIDYLKGDTIPRRRSLRKAESLLEFPTQPPHSSLQRHLTTVGFDVSLPLIGSLSREQSGLSAPGSDRAPSVSVNPPSPPSSPFQPEDTRHSPMSEASFTNFKV